MKLRIIATLALLLLTVSAEARGVGQAVRMAAKPILYTETFDSSLGAWSGTTWSPSAGTYKTASGSAGGSVSSNPLSANVTTTSAGKLRVWAYTNATGSILSVRLGATTVTTTLTASAWTQSNELDIPAGTNLIEIFSLQNAPLYIDDMEIR